MDKFKKILIYIKEQRGFDFLGYRKQMLERRIQKRMLATSCDGYDNYFNYMNLNQVEIDNLVDVLTINVSRFFRNTLTFEYLRGIVFPKLISEKLSSNERNIRIWSAGCSCGEEAYSIAILLNELLIKEEMQLYIFATDIDKKAIEKAKKAKYNLKSLENVKLGILQKYFTQHQEHYQVVPEICNRVQFSFYDLLDEKSYVPNDSIFGGFDIVFCRNVLIYFNSEYQKIIFKKLYKALNRNGLLVLGEAEAPIGSYGDLFRQESNCSKIYRKLD